MHPVVFSPAWFVKHQTWLLRLLAWPLVGRVLRQVLAIRAHDVGWTKPIVQLLPHAYTVDNGDGTFTTDFRTHSKYAKRLFYVLWPLWAALHAWDAWVANPWVPALNLGFDTLTVYPDPDVEVSSVDGDVGRTGVSETWNTIRAGAGTHSWDGTGGTTEMYICVIEWDSLNTNMFAQLHRGIVLFDTSPIPADATVESGTLSYYGKSTTIGTPGQTVNVFTSSPASNTSLTTSDFGTFGSTSLSTAIATTSWNTAGYNAFPLNTTGLAAITKAGITKLGTRESYDADGTPGVWSYLYVVAWSSEQTGSANDPKLDVTYSIPGLLLVKN